jgi:hypothetical protein
MIGIGVGERLRAYLMAHDRRCEETVALTSEWMDRVFGTCDLVMVTRFIGDIEYRVLARRDVTTGDVPSVAGDEIKGPTVMFGYDDRNDRLRDLTDREVETLRWATRLCRWEEGSASRMVVAVEMYRCKDDRCAFEVMD